MATAELQVRRITDEADRRAGSSDYIQLDEGEKFLGIALFEGDPKVDEVGYYEYLDHWITGGKGKSVPCAGPDCIYCEDGDRPRTRAKSLWWVLKDAKQNEVNALRMFNLGSTLIGQFTELRAEGDKIKGRQFRVSRPTDKSYVLMPKPEISKVAEVKGYLADAPDLGKLVLTQLKKAMEGVAMKRALEDDEEEAPSPAKAKSNGAKGKSAKEAEEEPTTAAEWPDPLDELEVVVVSVDKKGNFFTASHEDYEDTKDIYTTEGIEFDLADLEEDQLVTVSTLEQDADGDYILSGEPEVSAAADPDAPGNELPDSIEAEVLEVTAVEEANSTLDVKNDELEFTLYFLDTMAVDFDDYPVGTKISVTAEKDRQGDLVATDVPEVVKDKAAAKKGAVAKKGATAKKGK